MNTELCADHKWLAGSNVRTCGGCLARERATLLEALRNQGLLQNTATGVVWHVHDCPASFDFAECNYRCRVAREAFALAGTEPLRVRVCDCAPGDTCSCASDCDCRERDAHLWKYDVGWRNIEGLKETRRDTEVAE